MKKPVVSVIMPVYNTERYVAAAIESVLAQEFKDFELIIVDDGGTDASMELCLSYQDSRIRIVTQENRGLAGARNTGIRAAQGKFIAFIDADDLWMPKKLQTHVAHLYLSSGVGVSYAASRLIDEKGKPIGVLQEPKLKNVSAQDIFLRNPIGNGSAPVIRRTALDAIARPSIRANEMEWFDESFRQSEDIDCWMRIALQTTWKFEGVPGVFTDYRVNLDGLSTNVIQQYASWERMYEKVKDLAPEFAERWGALSRAFQLRYLARRAIAAGDRGLGLSLTAQAIRIAPRILLLEPKKTSLTLIAATVLRLTSGKVLNTMMMALAPLRRTSSA